MIYHRTAICLVFWTFVCAHVMGHSAETPIEVRDLIQRADPRANVEYCGAVATGTIDYYLFLLERKELAGLVLVKQRAGMIPVIVDVDTSLFPFHDDAEHSVEKPVQDAIELLLRRRSLVKKSRAPMRSSRQDPEVSAVGARNRSCHLPDHRLQTWFKFHPRNPAAAPHGSDGGG
jgi:hypothetical protein